MLSFLDWPKVITLSGFYCMKKIEIIKIFIENFIFFNSGDNCRQRKRPSDLMKCHTQLPCNKESEMEKGNLPS